MIYTLKPLRWATVRLWGPRYGAFDTFRGIDPKDSGPDLVPDLVPIYDPTYDPIYADLRPDIVPDHPISYPTIRYRTRNFT